MFFSPLSLKYLYITAIFLLSLNAQASTEQCFYKHTGIEKVPGSIHLPGKVCFSELKALQQDTLFSLYIDGTPINGLFSLELIKEDEQLAKYMTYIFSKEHFENSTRMNVTLRVSVDIKKDTLNIDYSYLAAEFFVFHTDGSFDTHIYYYKRKP